MNRELRIGDGDLRRVGVELPRYELGQPPRECMRCSIGDDDVVLVLTSNQEAALVDELRDRAGRAFELAARPRTPDEVARRIADLQNETERVGRLVMRRALGLRLHAAYLAEVATVGGSLSNLNDLYNERSNAGSLSERQFFSAEALRRSYRRVAEAAGEVEAWVAAATRDELEVFVQDALPLG